MRSNTMSKNEILISDFFKNDLPNYACYDNTRKIASGVDGMKNSMRKLIFTLMKKYPNEFVKSENLANIAAAFTNYLHGAQNLTGVINTLSQAFVGANNYPFTTGNSGGFGTRINPTCAAARYTRVSLSKIMKTMLDQRDDAIIGQQYFEGDYIEPKFFMPTFPLIFLNGSLGAISSGFSQNIYPRNPIEISEYIKKKLNGVENPRMTLLPWFRGFKGTVRYNAETQSNEVVGCIERLNTTNYVVTELPIGIEYQKYVEFLDKLIDNGTIVDYEDKCDPKTDNILFEIKTTRAFTKQYEDLESLNRVFHLVKTLPENLNCIDETGRIHEYSSVREILDSFIKLRLSFYDKRKTHLLKTLKSELEVLVSKYLFCKGVIEKTIIVSNKRKEEIVKQLEPIEKIIKQDETYDYLLRMPIHSLSREKMEELHEQIKQKKEEFLKIKGTEIKDMWTEDLKQVEKALKQ